MRRALPLAALVAGMAALPSVATAGGLAVRSVSAPHSATAGMPVAVEVGVARSRHGAAAKLRFYLSADRKRDRADVHLRGDATVAGGGRRVTRVSAQPVVPAGQGVGDYRLFACVEQGRREVCRAARRTLHVTAKPVGTRDLVDAAVAARKLTAEQGLVYRVFDSFGDGRLPAAYAGDEAAPDHGVMRDVAAGAVVGGFPAVGIKDWHRQTTSIARLSKKVV